MYSETCPLLHYHFKPQNGQLTLEPNRNLDIVGVGQLCQKIIQKIDGKLF